MPDRTSSHYWFYTAPHDPILVRRGDPLGLRQATDSFADLLAPGLSNRTADARWLSLLCWILQHANEAWQLFDPPGSDFMPGESRDAARQLYEWVRPLELLWVARVLRLSGDNASGVQLPGRRAVGRWLNEECKPANFAMAMDQFRRYRQTGVYGAYRVALRSIAGLTQGGDGWRPDAVGRQLANLVDGLIPRPLSLNRGRGKKPRPSTFWQERGWPQWRSTRQTDFGPESWDRRRRLTPDEIALLRPSLFGGKSSAVKSVVTHPHALRRRRVAEIIADTGTVQPATCCPAIAKGLRHEDDGVRLGTLPVFSELADAGVDSMNAVWMHMEGSRPALLAEMTSHKDVRCQLRRLHESAARWNRLCLGKAVAGLSVATGLADRVAKSGSVPDLLLKALLEHHEEFGGGLRWMALRGRSIIRVADERPTGGSRYRFRLAALTRMAIQCGVVTKCEFQEDGVLDEEL
jgi:hypothetical protein